MYKLSQPENTLDPRIVPGNVSTIDLVIGASIAQEARVECEDIEKPETVKVHSGFSWALSIKNVSYVNLILVLFTQILQIQTT